MWIRALLLAIGLCLTMDQRSTSAGTVSEGSLPHSYFDLLSTLAYLGKGLGRLEQKRGDEPGGSSARAQKTAIMVARLLQRYGKKRFGDGDPLQVNSLRLGKRQFASLRLGKRQGLSLRLG